MSSVLEQSTQRQAFLPPDNDALYEVVNGQRVELPPMGAQESGIANVLARCLWLFFGESPLGHVVVEMLFDLGLGKQERRPDVAYVSLERWPGRSIPRTRAWAVVPNLAAEVVSETNTAQEIQIKLHEYFHAGVQLVWVIFPDPPSVYVYEAFKSVRVLDCNDILDGGQVIPGFRLPLGNLFEVLPLGE